MTAVSDVRPPAPSPAALAPVRVPFRALAGAFVPRAEALDEAGWAALEAIVEDALADRPARMRRQLVLLVRVLDVLARLRWGRPLARLEVARRLALLERLERAPLLLLRHGVWGLRTLVFMGFYGRPEADALVGYRAHPRGWWARGTGPAASGAPPPVQGPGARGPGASAPGGFEGGGSVPRSGEEGDAGTSLEDGMGA